MVAEPGLTPVTIPALFTVATLLLSDPQLPPGLPLEVRVILVPTHTGEAPEREPALGCGFTVRLSPEVSVPQPLVTV